MKAYIEQYDLQTHIEAVVALKGKGSGPVSGIKFMISDAGDYFTDLSKSSRSCEHRIVRQLRLLQAGEVIQRLFADAI